MTRPDRSRSDATVGAAVREGAPRLARLTDARPAIATRLASGVSLHRGVSSTTTQTSSLISRDDVRKIVHDVRSDVDELIAPCVNTTHTHQQQGDDQRCTARLQSAESAILGAVLWLRDASMIGFAREAIALAQVELAIAGAELARLDGDGR